jgi:predicted transcriptional regulator
MVAPADYPGDMPRTAKPHLGGLERAVMDALWATPAGGWLTVREVHHSLVQSRDIAYTTVMTVLDRLARKELVTQERAGRAFLYRAQATRAALAAELMHEALDDVATDDRGQALVAFVGAARQSDLDALRRALADLEH